MILPNTHKNLIIFPLRVNIDLMKQYSPREEPRLPLVWHILKRKRGLLLENVANRLSALIFAI